MKNASGLVVGSLSCYFGGTVYGLQESAGHRLGNTKLKTVLSYGASPSDGLGALGKGL